jgi:hypothetical protein
MPAIFSESGSLKNKGQTQEVVPSVCNLMKKGVGVANGQVPTHYRKQLLKVQNRVEKERKFLKGQLEEFWESRKSTKQKELFSVLQTRHTNCQNELETYTILINVLFSGQFVSFICKNKNFCILETGLILEAVDITYGEL